MASDENPIFAAIPIDRLLAEADMKPVTPHGSPKAISEGSIDINGKTLRIYGYENGERRIDAQDCTKFFFGGAA